MTSPVSIGMMLWPCAINKMLQEKAHCAVLEGTAKNLQYYIQNIFNFLLFGSVVSVEVDVQTSWALLINNYELETLFAVQHHT